MRISDWSSDVCSSDLVTNGAVHFDRIHFHYGKQGGVITGLDLAVRTGEKIGVVGPSGAGKSTLFNVILRLYDLEAGRIKYGSAPCRERVTLSVYVSVLARF